MKLNLGCSTDRREGFVNVDMAPPADQIADLRERWPWADGTVEFVLARDIFEHLPDKRHTMNELHRVLESGGRAEIEVPSAARGAGAFQDPDHKSYWTANDFEYYEKGNFARERFRYSYGITADFLVLSVEQVRYQGKYDEVWKVRVLLEAVK